MHCLPLFFSFHMNRIASPRIINRIIITIILPILLSLLSCSHCSFCRLFGLSSLCGHCHSAKYILHQFHLLLTDIHTMSGQKSDAPQIQQCFLFLLYTKFHRLLQHIKYTASRPGAANVASAVMIFTADTTLFHFIRGRNLNPRYVLRHHAIKNIYYIIKFTFVHTVIPLQNRSELSVSQP